MNRTITKWHEPTAMSKTEKSLSEYDWPEVDQIDFVLGSVVPRTDLYELAKKEDISEGLEMYWKFTLEPGELIPHNDLKGSWKQKALRYAIAISSSYIASQQVKEAVCALIFQYTVDYIG